jgi:hypothetical protein
VSIVTYQYAQFAAAAGGGVTMIVEVGVIVVVLVITTVLVDTNPNCVIVRVVPSQPGGSVGYITNGICCPFTTVTAADL